MNWFLKAVKNYTGFSGRSQRAEYWFFQLFYLLLYIAAIMIDMATGMFNETSGLGVLSTIVWLGLLLPSIAVTVRRLHDTDRTGWWILIAFVPIIGTIVLLVFLVLDSTPGDNRFGPNPKSAGVAERRHDIS